MLNRRKVRRRLRMRTILAFDPALFVWDEQEVVANPVVYWNLVADTIDILQSVEESGVEVQMSAQQASDLLDLFPRNSESSISRSFVDYNRLVYSFLGRYCSIVANGDQTGGSSISPDLLGRRHFYQQISIEFSRVLAMVCRDCENPVLASATAVWGFEDTHVRIDIDGSESLVVVLLSSDDYQTLWKRLGRVFEASPKHDPLCGFGTRLPITLTTKELQVLLDHALCVGDDRVYVIRSRKADIAIMFRRHHENYYHGYPAGTRELARYAIRVEDLPEK